MVKIRSAVPDDAKRLLEIYAYYVADTAISLEYDVPSEEEFRSRIRNTLQKYPYLVLEIDVIMQGYAYAGSFRARAVLPLQGVLNVYLMRTKTVKTA